MMHDVLSTLCRYSKVKMPGRKYTDDVASLVVSLFPSSFTNAWKKISNPQITQKLKELTGESL